jgi:hypothetical protein
MMKNDEDTTRNPMRGPTERSKPAPSTTTCWAVPMRISGDDEEIVEAEGREVHRIREADEGRDGEDEGAEDDGGRLVSAQPAAEAGGPRHRRGFTLAHRGRGQCSVGDGLFGDVLPVDLGDDRAARHDEHPVAESFEFDAVRGENDDRGPAVRHLPDDAVDIDPRTRVHPLRRLLGQEHGRFGEHGAGEDDLLLIPPRERGDLSPMGGGLDAKMCDLPPCGLRDPAVPDDACGGRLAQSRHRDVLADAQGHEEALSVPVGGDVDDARGGGNRAASQADARTADLHFSRGAVDTREGTDELRLPVALDTRQSDDLAPPNAEAHVLEMRAGQARDFQPHVVARRPDGRPLGREDGLQGASDDEFDDVLLGHLISVERSADRAIAEHGEPVGDLLHLGDAVRDVDDRGVPCYELADTQEQPLDFFRAQMLGGLVEDQDLGPQCERLGDLDDKALFNREVRDPALDADAHLPGVEELLRPCGSLSDAPCGPIADADGHVLRDRKIGQQGRILADDAEPEFSGLLRRGRTEGAPGDLDGSLVWSQRTRRDGHEGGLSCAVLSDECVHFARSDLERDVLECADPREALDDSAQPQGNAALEPGIVSECARGLRLDIFGFRHGLLLSLSSGFTGRGSRRR